MVILSGIINIFTSQENNRFKIAITGDTNNPYLEWGMVAMSTIDESRFSMEFIEMTEEDAEKSLATGKISAYVVLPENFVENAMVGKVDPIKYVTTAGASGIVSMFKNEMTQIATNMVVYSQKGTYGIGDALIDNGLGDEADQNIFQISIEYVDLIFHRSELYTLEELGIASGLSMTEYFFCGISILLLMFMGLPYVTVYIKKDYSLNSLLVSRGYSSLMQLLCEYLSHLVSILILVFSIFAVFGIGRLFLPEYLTSFVTWDLFLGFMLWLIPVIIMLSAFNIMVFELSDNIVTGVLMHFFASLCLCYVSGCMYPIYAFPKVIQQIAVILPTGLARGCLAGCFNDSVPIYELTGVLVYAVLFFGVALIVRNYKMKDKRG